jgi:Raf kinase inhibitor-like YbhB/YbcL family protein
MIQPNTVVIYTHTPEDTLTRHSLPCLILLILCAACAGAPQAASPSLPAASVDFTLTSTAFENEGVIPAQYGQVPFETPYEGYTFVCAAAAEGHQNLSPQLSWSGAPAGTVSFMLLMVDDMHYAYPEAPAGAYFGHWLVYNLPGDATQLPEGAASSGALPQGVVQGVNDYPPPYNAGYGGPCPGAEEHYYIFTLYALDTTLDISPELADLPTLQSELFGHILDQTELRGYFTGP